jgi:hypothetical protein
MKYLTLFDLYTESDIVKICKKYKIENWSINSNGLVDVDGDVSLSFKGLTKLPLSFGHVSGNFYCSCNKLTSLMNGPQIVGGNFICSSNQLTTLRFAPEGVEGRVFVLPNPISDIPEKYLTREYLQFIVKEQPDWRLYDKNGSMRLDRLEEMIEWGIESNKIKPL